MRIKVLTLDNRPLKKVRRIPKAGEYRVRDGKLTVEPSYIGEWVSVRISGKPEHKAI